MTNFTIKIFADGANLDSIKTLSSKEWIKGLTTNPTLMKKEGITDYKEFSLKALGLAGNKPLSLEVFSDDLDEMILQAREINSWGDNVFVKIPVMNTKGIPTSKVIKVLADEGVKLNVTAVFTKEQIIDVISNLNADVPSIVSVFAGRIADTGIDPVPLMKEAKKLLSEFPKSELLWASPREILNIVHAEDAGCDIITITPGMLTKLDLLGKDLLEFSQETVAMFRNDALSSGFEIDIAKNHLTQTA